jgi:hypothetical protein
MPRTHSSIEKIRAELAWVTETPDPTQCGLSQCSVLPRTIVGWRCNRNSKDVHHAFVLEREEFNLAWQRM